MELKTLKDISTNGLEFREKRTTEYLIESLKAEAVKWYKLPNDELGQDPYCCAESVRDFIKRFFNLTDDDLKEEKKDE